VLDRIGRQEAVVSKLDAAALDACLTRQDESPVRASMKEAEKLGLNFAPAIYINGERGQRLHPRRADGSNH